MQTTFKSSSRKDDSAIYASAPPGLSDEGKRNLLKMSEISLWIDNYDEIFSAFDPRPFSKRALSIDFLSEVKRAWREKSLGVAELKLLVPKDQRKAAHEKVIKKKLKEYFELRFETINCKISRLRKRAFIILFSGFLIQFVASLMPLIFPEGLALNFILVMLEPTGWFVMWYGFDQIFYTAKQEKQKKRFYKKMAECDIKFISY